MLFSPLSPMWRKARAALVGVAAIALGLTALAARAQTSSDPGAAIRPFRIDVSQAALADLRSRANATRWPDQETVSDDSQGLQLAKVKALVEYWGTGYDWRRTEARLNALPQFVTTIDGLDIHFIHVRSRHPNAMPLIITHGWPGSFLEMIKAIEPLTDPTAFGGRAEDAFDVVIPSIPGYGFSSRPTGTGWGPERIARAWDVLMKRLGYARYVSQGGDHGSVISDAMARQAPAGLLGIHLSMPPTLPNNVVKALNEGGAAPAGLSAKEKAAFDALSAFFSKNAAYGAMMVTRPQTLGYALTDSPAGMAAWMYDKITQWTFSGGVAERSLTRDEILDDLTLYWVTNTSVSAARFYWENNNNNFSSAAQRTAEISLPVAVTVFPGEIYRAPESWTRQAYRHLVYFHEVEKGGHFAAWEEPLLFADEMRAAFRSLR